MRLEPSELFGWFEIVRVLVLFLVLVLVRGLPALLYRRHLSGREVAASGLLQATNLSFIVVAVTVGEELGAITVSGGEGLIAAGLLSAILLPPIAHRLLRTPSHGSRGGLAARENGRPRRGRPSHDRRLTASPPPVRRLGLRDAPCAAVEDARGDARMRVVSLGVEVSPMTEMEWRWTGA
jgi:hypothetical protein